MPAQAALGVPIVVASIRQTDDSGKGSNVHAWGTLHNLPS
jgi:hypothetical protein